jgi:GGDEF domain-containing protein
MNVLEHIASPQHDPLTGFGDYQALIGDLIQALEPGSPPAVLAVFELGGSNDHRQALGERASDALIVRCAEQFGRVIRPAGLCYRPRRDEFCALLTGSIDELNGTLLAAAQAIQRGAEPCVLSACFGSAVLPEEASDPVDLLILADERLSLGRGSSGPRERRRNAHAPG